MGLAAGFPSLSLKRINLNQLMRRLLSCTKDLDDEDKGFYLTLAAHKQVQTMKSPPAEKRQRPHIKLRHATH